MCEGSQPITGETCDESQAVAATMILRSSCAALALGAAKADGMHGAMCTARAASTDTCMNGVCLPRAKLGEPCSTIFDCVQGFYKEGVCAVARSGLRAHRSAASRSAAVSITRSVL